MCVCVCIPKPSGCLVTSVYTELGCLCEITEAAKPTVYYYLTNDSNDLISNTQYMIIKFEKFMENGEVASYWLQTALLFVAV